jgi:membrane fusion protein (multidrug efflux system)
VLAKARLAKTELKAPFAGIVGLRRISAGDYVTPGQDLVNLEDITPLKADFRVAETYLPLVREGQPIKVEVDALPGKSFAGSVYAIDPRIDESGRSIVIRALLPNDEKMLKPGLFARVTLVVEERENAILVPEEALMPQQGGAAVYKVVDGKAEMTPVQTGLRRQGMVEITEGLRQGDVVITAGQMKIQPGAPVTVLPPAGQEQSAL